MRNKCCIAERLYQFFQGVLGTLELKIGSLVSEKIIIGSLKSEKIGSLQIPNIFLLKNPSYTSTEKQNVKILLQHFHVCLASAMFQFFCSNPLTAFYISMRKKCKRHTMLLWREMHGV